MPKESGTKWNVIETYLNKRGVSYFFRKKSNPLPPNVLWTPPHIFFIRILERCIFSWIRIVLGVAPRKGVQRVSTFPTVVVGGVMISGNFCQNRKFRGGCINGGRWKNRKKWSKFSQKSQNLKLGQFSVSWKNILSKIVTWGGGRNTLKCLEKIQLR